MLLLIAPDVSPAKRQIEHVGQMLTRHVLVFLRRWIVPKPLHVLTSANAVTIGRMILVIPIMSALLNRSLAWAFWLFLAASLSDLLDGWIARYDGPTELGSFLDATCDKIMTLPVILLLLSLKMLPLWLWSLTGILLVFEGLNTHANLVHFRKLRTAMGVPKKQVFSTAFGQIKFWAICLAIATLLAARAWPATFFYTTYFSYFAFCVASLFAWLSLRSKLS